VLVEFEEDGGTAPACRERSAGEALMRRFGVSARRSKLKVEIANLG
jgi:hypothetical protein